VERAQYEADLAQRRYLKVDSDNRLVADVLEVEWNEKLRALADAWKAVEQHQRQDQLRVSDQVRQEMLKATNTFAAIWRDRCRPDRERKRAVRLIIEDVILLKKDVITAHIRFKGGALRTLFIPLPPPFKQSRLTSAEILAKIDNLIDAYTDADIAEQLNILGYRTFAGLRFQASHVSQLRRKHGLKNRFTRLREAGLRTAEELTEELEVPCIVQKSHPCPPDSEIALN
jgi:hypothetical protein